MRKDNRVFLVIIFFVLLFGIWQGYNYTKKIYYYYSLDQEALAEITKKEVVQIKRDRYQVLVGLRFSHNNQEREASKVLPKIFLNPWAAEAALKKMTLEKIPIFFSNKHTEIIEVKKIFPTHAFVSFLILVVIFFYFLILKVWLEREEKKVND